MRPRCPTNERAGGGGVSAAEALLALHVAGVKLPPPQREYPFAAMEVGRGRGVKQRLRLAGLRNWRFDFAWPPQRLAVEVEGGAYSYGRHTRGRGFSDDLRKYHHALRLGWVVYRCDPDMIRSGVVVGVIQDILNGQWHERHRSGAVVDGSP